MHVMCAHMHVRARAQVCHVCTVHVRVRVCVREGALHEPRRAQVCVTNTSSTKQQVTRRPVLSVRGSFTVRLGRGDRHCDFLPQG